MWGSAKDELSLGGRVPRGGQASLPNAGALGWRLSLTLRKTTGSKELVYILLNHQGLGTFLFAPTSLQVLCWSLLRLHP